MLNYRLTKDHAWIAAAIGAIVILPGLVLQAPPIASPQSKAAAPATSQLEPTGVYGRQSHVALTAEQVMNAKKIVDVVNQRHLPKYAAVVSVATALQESKLKNVAGNDDSIGLFQQRPSCGWGTPGQLVDPCYATNAFLNALQNTVPNYQHVPLQQAAQTTQQPAFPEVYEQWEDEAAGLVQAILTHRV